MACPCPEGLVFLMLWVGQDLKKFMVATDSADVLGRCRAASLEDH